jgi:transposase
MRDYRGNTIFLGIDVHKATYSVTAICEKNLIKRDQIEANPETLVAYCKRYFPGALIKSAYEAGFCGFNLHRYLTAKGIDNIVVHPASIEVEAHNRLKTDKRDSLKIATQLSVDRLKGIYIPSPEMEAQRAISRLRDTWTKEKTRTAVRLKSALYMYGIKPPSSKISHRFMHKLLAVELPEGIRFCIDELASAWIFFSDKIKLCNEIMKRQAAKDSLEEFYTSIPGVGATTARVLSNELGDMSQFSSEKDLFSYCGLTPCEYSSGETVRRGHISRQGKPILRKLLTQCAWVAIKKDPNLKEAFERIGARAGSKRAIQAIAKKIIGRARACIKSKSLYVNEVRTPQESTVVTS